MAKILIDTSVLVAYFNERDALHAQAMPLIDTVEDVLLTDYVLDEFLNVLTRRKNKANAIKAAKQLLSTPHSFTHIAAAEFLIAWTHYQEKNNFSFTDCTNLAVMQTFGITTIATFDREFENVKGIQVLK